MFDSLHLYARKPTDTILRKLLPLRLQFGLVQTEIIHTTKTQDRHRWKCRTNTIHERPTRETEVVSHAGVWPDRSNWISPAFEVVATTQVLQIFVINAEVGCKHWRGELAAIHTVANKGIDKAWAFGWLVVSLERRREISLVNGRRITARWLGLRCRTQVLNLRMPVARLHTSK